MGSKRGQITAFIVVGILLLFLVSIGLYLYSQAETKKFEDALDESQLPSDVVMIKNYVEVCLEESAAPGVFLLGIQGGYIYEPPEPPFQTEYASIAYGLVDGEVVMPTRGYMELEISKYIEESVEYCINDFVIFEGMGIKIKDDDLKAITQIGNDRINLLLEYPLSIYYADSIFHLDTFATTIPLRLGHIIDTANQIMDHHIESDVAAIDFRFLTGFDTYITILPFDKDTSVYAIHDENVSIDDAELEFMFAMKDDTKNHPPELDFIKDFVLTKNMHFTTMIVAGDDDEERMEYSSDSNFFPVDQDSGIINVTPQRIGTYQVTFRATDPQGSYAEQKVRIIVEDEISQEESD